jgi:hypothetical protein
MFKNRYLLICSVAVGCLLILGLVIWLKVHRTYAASACVNKLRIIDSAKQHWALTYNKSTNDIPDWDDLQPYYPSGWTNKVLVCPSGAAYKIGRVGEPPTCPVGGQMHTLP